MPSLSEDAPASSADEYEAEPNDFDDGFLTPAPMQGTRTATVHMSSDRHNVAVPIPAVRFDRDVS